MNKCEQYCQAIKRMAHAGGGGLPAEYQQVEYLYLEDRYGNNPYIETTVPLTSTYYLKVTYMLGSVRIAICGSMTTTYPIGAAQATVNGRMIISRNKDAYLPNIENTLYTVEAYYDSNISDYRAFINGVEASYRSDSGNTNNNGFSLFRSNWAGSSSTGLVKIYGATIKESINGKTTLDLVPCYRILDNKPGMYDLVTNTFYTNVGTGEFTVGPDI